MISKDEGYIKFNADHTFTNILFPDDLYNQMTQWRTKLFDIGLIGETPQGIGFGNISIRYQDGFYITGSATGNERILSKEGYAYVTSYDYVKNQVVSKGLTKASSESMSHAAIYESKDEIMSVIHIHNEKMWRNYLEKLPTTTKDIAFGTPEMAYDVQKILKEKENYKKGIIIMGGHEDGIITFGKDLESTANILISYLL